VKKVLKENYLLLYYGYKYYSAMGNKELFSIWENGLKKFCDEANIFDNFDENFDWKFLTLDFVLINKSRPNMPKGKKMVADPEKGIVRYEFLELICRIAGRKFLDTGKSATKSEAI